MHDLYHEVLHVHYNYACMWPCAHTYIHAYVYIKTYLHTYKLNAFGVTHFALEQCSKILPNIYVIMLRNQGRI